MKLITLLLCSLLLLLPFSHAEGAPIVWLSQMHGNSMTPFLAENDYVYLEEIGPFEPLTIDEIYLYMPTWKSYKGNGVVHRLYWIFFVGDEVFYIFKGDNNDYFDPPVKRWQIKEIFREKAPWQN